MSDFTGQTSAPQTINLPHDNTHDMLFVLELLFSVDPVPSIRRLRKRTLTCLFALVLLAMGTAPVAGQSITSFQPESGTEGTTVYIYGSGFDATPSNNTVMIDGKSAVVTEARTTHLTVEVPSGVEGPAEVSVTRSDGAQATASSLFTGLSQGSALFREAISSTTEEVGGLFDSVADGDVDWGDYDQDGDLDFILTGENSSGPLVTRVYINDGSGSFTPQDYRELTSVIGAADWGDYDDDGDLDLAVTGSNASGSMTTIYRNDGGSFVDIGASLTGFQSGATLTWKDIDSDGDLDLIISGRNADDYAQTVVYENTTDGSGQRVFNTVDTGLPDRKNGSMAWGDFDSDGDQDVILNGHSRTNSMEGGIYENDGTGQFTKVSSSPSGLVVVFGSSDWGDYNGDGELDLVVSGLTREGPVTRVYKNDGDGTFTRLDAGLIGTEGGEVAWGDFDADGDQDLIVTGDNRQSGDGDEFTARLYRYDGSDTFRPVLTGITGVIRSTVDWGDYDNDGDLDLLATGLINDGGDVSTILYENAQLLPPSAVRVVQEQLGELHLSWKEVSDPALDGYRIYRSTEPIGESQVDLSPIDSVGPSTTSFTDDNAEAGKTYYYRVTAIDTSGYESNFSDESSAFLYPAEVTASVDRSFGGAAAPSDYRLVALPGAADRPLGDVVDGEAGSEWQAHWDNGSADDYLVQFDGSDTFRFRKGNGFWLTATNGWTFDETVQAVDPRGDSAVAIRLHEGWNIISNPLDKDVDWSAVKRENSADLQPIWAFNGAFDSTDTFASAATGEAYYFFNDEADRDSLTVPYPGTSTTKVRLRRKNTREPMLALSATPKQSDQPISTVYMGLGGEAAAGDRLMAPPGRFETVSLRVKAEQADDQKSEPPLLMAQRRPMEGQGETFTLRLTSRAEGPVQLSAKNLSAVESQEVVLLDPSSAQSYDLRAEGSVTLRTGEEGKVLKVAIGTEEHVDDEKKEIVPDEVRLTSYPNPVRQQGTIEYTLPEAKEVTLRIYDVLGREVATLVNGQKEAGRHRVRIDTDRMTSGMYFGRLTVGDQTHSRKITVVR